MRCSKSRFLCLWAVCGSLFAARAPADEPGTLNLESPQVITSGAAPAKNHPVADACTAPGCRMFVPNMLGDALGVPLTGFPPVGPGVILYPAHIAKIAENHNVLPQDRVALSYGYVNNFPAVAGADGFNRDVDLHQFNFLFEKTFLGGRASAEVIVPFASTLNAAQPWSQVGYGERATEFGNLAFGVKGLLVDRPNFALSTGLLVEAPTARDLTVQGGPLGQGQVSNDAWHFTPYMGARWTRGEHLFTHAFVSYRRPTADNRQSFNGVLVGADYDVQDLLMVDGGVGYWLYRNPTCRGVRGIAPTVELHYATTTTDARDAFNAFTINRVDSLNLTAGATALIGERGTLGVGVSIPLRDNNLAGYGATDRVFDWALTVQVNLFFGGGRR